MKRYKLPHTTQIGQIIDWANKYDMIIDLSFNGGYITTKDKNLIEEIIYIGGREM